MCGDGTNDVGALKHAQVGVALLANAPLKAPEPPKHKKPTEQSNDPSHLPRNKRRSHTDRNNVTQSRAQTRAERMAETQQQLQKMLQEIEEQDQAQVVKLGDASIAAPFTSKLSSIQCSMLI